jgi:tRNA (cmo5U34)-methyltransferase
MLKEAKHKLSGYGENQIRFLDPAGTQDISLPAELQPDIITAIQCHHYLSREARKSASEICFNTLRPGGLYITFENIRPFTERGVRIGKKYWGNYQLNRGKNEEQVNKHLERFDSEYFPINIEEHLELYRECGFETVELLWYSCMQAGFYCIK